MAVALELRNVTKRFGPLVANDDISFTVAPGEIHCLLGENGAGKSTLMNIAFGMLEPDEGDVVVAGQPQRFASSLDAIAAGVGMVHQHFQLIQRFTVAENVSLGAESVKHGRLDLDTASEKIRQLSVRFGLHTDPSAIVENLSVGAQQRVELLKALYRDADVLILDEPTAVLTPSEVDEFFAVVHSLTDLGKAIVFITHKLREVLAIADRVTVLRHGRVVGTADPATATAADLAALMVGRSVNLSIQKAPADPREVVLDVVGVSVRDGRGLLALDDIGLDVRAGEIVGIAGVEGNGQTELVEALTGLLHPQLGTITVSGTPVQSASPRTITELGVAHIPEDRHRFGVIDSFTIADNTVLNQYNKRPFARRGLRRPEAVRERAQALVEQFDIRGPGVDATVSQLSGGNQQKVVVARELAAPRTLIIAAQPTRGLDVGSIEFIHRQIVDQRDAGAAVLLVSAELDEVMQLADRIGVLYRGRLNGGLVDRDSVTREDVGMLMAGASPTPDELKEHAAAAADGPDEIEVPGG